MRSHPNLPLAAKIERLIYELSLILMKIFDSKHPKPLEELFGDILFSGKMTKTDRYHLRTAILRNSLTDEHQDIINRLIYSTKRGRLRMMD